MIKINPEIFKAYDVRGIYPDDLDEEGAYQIGRAFGIYLKNDLKKQDPIKVALAQDMRVHSPFLAREVLRGLVDEGVNVFDIGEVATPAFYYAVSFKDLDAGVMVTASHNPKEYNGFKFCAQKATPIGLESGLDKIRDYAFSDLEKPKGKGEVSQLEGMTEEYVQQDLSYINPSKIKKLKIVADAANSMGATYLDSMFKRVPAELTKINWELNGNMPVHEANPLKEETLQQLKEVLKSEKADFGIAPDGDGDRIAFLDENGDVIPAAAVTGLISKLLLQKNPGSKIGHDLRMSKVVREIIKEAGGEPVEVRVGHSYIKKLMTEQDMIFAGELSMHYYFRENYNYESPVMVAAGLLLIRSLVDRPFSEIWKTYQKYSHSGEINFEVEDKEGMIKKLEEQYKDGKISHLDGVKVEFDDWWFNVRPSNTEPVLRLNLEADTEELMKQKLEEIKKTIQS